MKGNDGMYVLEIIMCIVIALLLAMFMTDYAKAQGIPNTSCEWTYINDCIYTECGHCIADGCPYCAKNICISSKAEELE